MNFLNLSVLRKLVQLGAFAFLVYGGLVVGYYSADKLSGALFFFADHGDFTGDYGLVEKTQNTFEDCLSILSSTGRTKQAASWANLRPAFIRVGELGRNRNSVIIR